MKTIGRSTSFVFDPKKNQHHKDTQQRRQEQATSLNDTRDDENVIGTLKASPISTHNQLLINHNRQVPHQYEDVKQLKGIVFDQNMRISVIYFIIFLLFYFYFFFRKSLTFFLKKKGGGRAKNTTHTEATVMVQVFASSDQCLCDQQRWQTSCNHCSRQRRQLSCPRPSSFFISSTIGLVIGGVGSDCGRC